jgi:hypothetical protein
MVFINFRLLLSRERESEDPLLGLTEDLPDSCRLPEIRIPRIRSLHDLLTGLWRSLDGASYETLTPVFCSIATHGSYPVY